jgi:hypothetical protein
MEDLRNHLFATLEALQDNKKPMELKRAQTIAGVAQVLVDTAKVEAAFIKATGGSAGSQFFPAAPKPELPKPGQPRLVSRV